MKRKTTKGAVPSEKKHGIKLYRPDFDQLVTYFVFFTLFISLIFVIAAIITAPSSYEEAMKHERIKSDYVLMLVQCVVGVAAMLLPSFLEHKINVKIPSNMLIFYALFLYGAIYLGEIRNFYFEIEHWDTILHSTSGIMLGALGFSVVTFLSRSERVYTRLSPSATSIFAFCFAVTAGVVWEIYEFATDEFFGTNMQKFNLSDGVPLVGRAALADTMEDMILDFLGAAFICVIGYISLKYKKGWVERFMIKRIKKKARKARNKKQMKK